MGLEGRSDAFARFHPAVNLIYFMPVLIYAMILIHPAYIAVSLLGAISYYLILAGRRKGIRRILGMLPVPIAVTLINPLLNIYGKTELFKILGRPYTLEALYYGAALGTVFYTVLIWFMCWSVVMTNDRFTCLLGNAMPGISLLLVMVFRLVPAYQRKAVQISTARGCLGRGTGNGTSKKEKIAAGMEVLTAMTGWALESSVQTADSMRSRGYSCAKRTSFNVYSFSVRDGLICFILIACAVLTAVNSSMGFARAEYTPEFILAKISGFQSIAAIAIYMILIFVPVIIDLREEIIWHYSISKL